MEWLTYLLKVTACTVLFFGFYLLVLRKLTFFKINRFYLLASLLLSFIIPALQFEVKREITVMETEVPVNIPEIKPIAQVPVQLIQPIVVEYQPEIGNKIDWMVVIYYVYGITASLLLLVCLWRLFSLLKHTNGYTKNGDGLKMIIKTEGFTNCSFFNYVFINDEDLSTADLSILLKHEQVHARQYHSIDKIVLMVFKAVLWFNPVVYLYDKALEQIHEYEADEITSADFGNQEYANLLLKLAISKSDMPLIHNFVKSPIKDRIKMLFHAKSKNMKKLMYVLAIPVVMGLIWLFAVQVVYAQNKKEESKPSKDFYKGTLKGKVLKIEKTSVGGYTFDLLSEGKVYAVEATGFKEKIKIGDELIAYISGRIANMKRMDKSGKVTAETDGPIYNPTKVTTLTGKLIYEPKIDKHAFLYEANKARFASSKIKSIEKGANGKIEKIVLNDGFFTISLNLKTQNLKDDNFKAGDKVLVKFIGEKLVSKNTFSTDKMIVLYSEPKKYTIKNEALYNRFYLSDGKQKVAAMKNDTTKVAGPVEPKIISFKKIIGDVKHKVSYMENAVIDISNCRLEARYVELDQANNKMIAKNASLKNSKQNVMVKSNLMTFDLKKGDYRIDIGDETKTGNDLEKLINSIAHRDYIDNSEIDYNASDSVTISKDKSIISLFGNAKVFHNKTVLSGTKIVYNKKNSSVMVNNATMMSGDNKTVKADSIYFDLKTTKARLYGADFKR
ncbi:lipopolysaccharide export system protein LptA [Flavobacterium sp. W4I14]|nr:lipopolysaccharide export system protein LptA [Flavobacterium sp. W4I14]